MNIPRFGRGYGRGQSSILCNSFDNRRVAPISTFQEFARLSEWVTENNATDLLQRLDSLNFLDLLDTEYSIDGNLMVAILNAIVKCLHSENRFLLRRFFNAIASKNNFFRRHVNEYLNKIVNQIFLIAPLLYKITEKSKIQSIADLLLLLNELLHLFPNQMSPVFASLTSIVESIRKIHGNIVLTNDVMKLLDNVEAEMKKSKAPLLLCSVAPQTNPIACEPPNDFRSISLVPTHDDIYNKSTFLRKNIINGAYKDVDHYLDVQFRLMREDFIRSLRNGIAEYLKSAQSGQRLNRLQDSFVYYNVRVSKVEMTENGLEARLQLDLSNLPKINWKTSRRLMCGSLICLSSNRFKNFLVATIGGLRKLKDLYGGYFEVIIDPSHESNFFALFNENPDLLFVVIEPLSYFEAYRHILKTLQEFTEETFPLKKYIVNVERHLNHPEYLTNYSSYNFASSFIKARLNSFDVSRVKVLKTDQWPTPEEIGMDDSQHSSLKDALTREVSLIQGPPGTGKTFIGLRVIETLLNNRHVWDSSSSHTILVTCYTNHSLDQFLEGIEPFCDQLLRIGGRCKSATLQKYTLRELRTRDRHRRRALREPNHIGKMIHEYKDLLNVTNDSINYAFWNIKQIRRTLLSLKSLEVIQEYISEDHVNSIKSLVEENANSCDSFEFREWLKNWLGYNIVDNLYHEDEVTKIEEDDTQRIYDERYAETESDSDESDDEAEGSLLQEKKFQKYCELQINSGDVMSIEDARCANIGALEHEHRWRLYRLWVKLYISGVAKVNKQLYVSNETAKIREKLQELRLDNVLRIIGNVKIIGATTTGAAKNRELICRLKPKIVIVEEAAEILESHIITALSEYTKHLILIGDHIQLKPNPAVYDLAVNYNLNVSLFERLIRNNLSYSMLKIQHRMHPNISGLLVPLFYSELENHDSVTKYEPIKGVSRNLFFIGHSHEESVVNETKSRYNEFEVDFVYRLCKHLLLQGYEPSQITVLTMYSAQMFRIKSVMKEIEYCCDVRVSAVDNYQGEENDIIICSFVRSNSNGDIGFLKTPNRINVALSRAKKGFYGIGNFEQMSSVSKNLWKPLLQKLKYRGIYGTELELYCQNHPQTKLLALQSSDFDGFPEGGCPEPCDKYLPCGHICPKSCHVYDVEHKKIKCIIMCPKISCDKGHKCTKRCHFPNDCEPCAVTVEKQRFCGHAQNIECQEDVDEIKCKSLCPNILTCGHQCMGKCGDDCTKFKCQKMVVIMRPCRHSYVEVPCWLKANKQKLLSGCAEPCNEILKCQHQCTGSCSKCCQGRLHKKCEQKCERFLICGHLCKSPCVKICPPCCHICQNVLNCEIQGNLADNGNAQPRFVSTRDQNSDKRAQLEISIMQLNAYLERIEEPFAEKILKTLRTQSGVVRSLRATKVDLENVSNVIAVAESWIEMVFPSDGSSHEIQFNERLNSVFNFIRHDFENNEQQCSDIALELDVLRNYRSVLKLTRLSSKLPPEIAFLFDEITDMFNTVGRMNVKQFEEFDEMVSEITKKCKLSANGTQMKLNTMQNTYQLKVSKDHLYCVTECGDTTRCSNCAECRQVVDASISQLLPSNTMDIVNESIPKRYNCSARQPLSLISLRDCLIKLKKAVSTPQ